MACPGVDELARLADGQLAGDALATIERHFDVCADCAAVAAAMAAAQTAGDDDAGVSWLAPGDTVGRYEVVEWLGAGGMGQVYVADDPQLGRHVALKLVRGTGSDERLIAEARAMARLSHPNVVAIYDAGSDRGRAFIAMELVRGEPLARWCRGERSWREILRVFVAAGRGLAAAHQAGILHRDFKPANVLCGDDGRVLVGDFGLARSAVDGQRPTAGAAAVSPAHTLTVTGTVLGTPAYMAPEQFRGEAIDARADQFSFAVALFQALTRVLPFAGSGPETLLRAIESGRMRPVPPGVRAPSAVFAVLSRALRPDPAERFPSMDALLDALTTAARRRRRLGALAAAGVAVIGTAGALAFAREPARTLGQLCGDPSAELAAVYDDERRASLEAAFAATGKPNAGDAWVHARRGFDRFASDYLISSRRVCLSTHVAGDESPELGARREACLDDKLRDLDRVMENLVTADPLLLDDAVSAAHGLAPTAECEGAAVLGELSEPPPEALQAEVEAARERLRDVRALISLDRNDEALAAAEPLVAELAHLGYRPLEAYGLLSLAQIQIRTGHPGEAKESAAGALAAAQAAGHAKFSVNAALYLAQFGADEKPPAPDVDRWLAIARANAEKLGNPPSMTAAIERAAGRVHFVRGDYREALAALQHELALYRQIYGEDSAAVADALGSLASVQLLLGQADPAIAGLERADELLRAALGEGHADTRRAMVNLALAYKRARRVAEAEALQRRILAVSEERYGKDSLQVGEELVNLANSVGDLDRPDEAEAMLRRARDIFAAHHGPRHYLVGVVDLNLTGVYESLGRHQDAHAAAARGLEVFESALPADHPTLAQAHGIVGTMAAKLGRHDEARAHQERALAIQVAKLGAGHPKSITTLRRLGEAEVATGRRREGIAHLERAVTLASAPEQSDPRLAPVSRLFLANALAGRDPRRARQLAQEALAAAEAGGEALADVRTEAEALLADLDRR